MDVIKKPLTFLVSSLAGGGAEGVCVNVANGLADLGYQVNLVVLHLNNAIYLDRVSEKVNLKVLGVNQVRYAGMPLLSYIRSNKPETFIVFDYELAVLLVLLRGVFKLKYKIFARNVNTISQRQSQAQGIWFKYVVLNLNRMFYGKVDHVINQCKAMRDDLVKLHPQLKDKTSVIYNPVAQHIETYAMSIDFDQIEKKEYLLCVGRLEKQKGFHYAIEGFASVAKEFPNLRLKIVGQGSLEKELKQCAMDLGVEEKVDFVGFQADMIPLYINAKATVLTSLYEGFPNVLLESICLGTPVVAFDCPSGPSEIVQEGVNGFLVDYQNVEQLKIKLRKILLTDFDIKQLRHTVKRNHISEVSLAFTNLFAEN